MAIESTGIDAPWRSVLPLIPYSYPWCVGCDMDCREIELLTCSDCGEKCMGCLSKKCADREIRYDRQMMEVDVND
jgi:hypothetical protein